MPRKTEKRTGKSVEEIVEKDKKRKAKQAEAEEKRRAEEKKIQEEVAEKSFARNPIREFPRQDRSLQQAAPTRWR